MCEYNIYRCMYIYLVYVCIVIASNSSRPCLILMCKVCLRQFAARLLNVLH